jgi:small subunit ribosomal protein S18
MSAKTLPKTRERLIAFRKANRKMSRRRIDLPKEEIHYKNVEVLTKFCTETGKILPRRVTGVPAWMHRKITREIKRSRAVNLMNTVCLL